MKRKTTKKPIKMPNPNEFRDILSHIVKDYSEVSLYKYVMHVNGVIFLLGVFSHIALV